jgi:hypothetical protein
MERGRVKRLPVDMAELAALFDEARRGPVRAFFDRATGVVESLPRDAEVEGVFDDILAAPDRWVEIQPVPGGERLDLRRRFVDEGVSDPYLRLRLFEALDPEQPATGPPPRKPPRDFARFDALLRDHPPLLDRWLAFRAGRLELLARTWLAALHIEPAQPRGPTSA